MGFRGDDLKDLESSHLKLTSLHSRLATYVTRVSRLMSPISPPSRTVAGGVEWSSHGLKAGLPSLRSGQAPEQVLKDL